MGSKVHCGIWGQCRRCLDLGVLANYVVCDRDPWTKYFECGSFSDFTEQDLANLDFINQGGSLWDVPYKETWGVLNDMFANMGGTGMTLGLIIAIFIASKRPEQREIAKMSLVPGIFQINEPMIFGLPIVLNPIMIIPFILTPMVNILVGYFVTVVWPIMPTPAIGVPWTTPESLISFRNWRKCDRCGCRCRLSCDFGLDLFAIRDRL